MIVAGVSISAEEVFAAPITPAGLSISPDGAWVGMLYLRAGRWCLGFFATTGDPCPREIVLPCGRPGGLTWSPDGKAVAFFADHKDSSEANVFVVALASGGISAAITEAGWHAFIPSWSPDNRMLAFSAYAVPRLPHEPPRLFLASVPGGEVKQLTTGESADIRPHFSPDGKTIAFVRGGDIWLLSLLDGGERQLVAEGDNELHFGCFSPDGAQIVFQRNSVDGGQVTIVEIATGAERALTDGNTADLRPSWSSSGRAISFVRDREQIVVAALDGTTLWKAAPRNGRVLAGLSSGTQWAQEAELLTFLDGDGNAWVAGPNMPARQVTQFAEPLKVKQQPKQVQYPSTGGVNVPALLLEPKGFVPGRYPAVVWLHGGPWAEAAQDLRAPPFSEYLMALLEAGFVVLLPDYRGSTGHGEAWEWVLPEQRGIVDVDDVLAAKRFLEESGIAAPGRIAVAGYSFGGYLTLMALARCSQEWACAASLWGLLDPRRLPSVWARDQHGLDTPDLAQQTPLNFLDRMRAPLLILHGAHDTISTIDEVSRACEGVRGNGTLCEVRIFDDTHGLPLHTDEAAELLVSFFARHTST